VDVILALDLVAADSRPDTEQSTGSPMASVTDDRGPAGDDMPKPVESGWDVLPMSPNGCNPCPGREGRRGEETGSKHRRGL